MPDYNLGRAHGQIAIDYDGSGVDEAEAGLQKVAASLAEADASLSQTQKTLKDTDRQFSDSGGSAGGYAQRLREVRSASEDVDKAEKDYHRTLLDSNATLDDVKSKYDVLTGARKRHTEAVNAERDASRALGGELSAGRNVVRAMADVLPALESKLRSLATVQQDAARKSNLLARGLGDVAKVIAMLGPETEGVAGGFELASKGVDKFSASASASGQHVRNFVKDLAGFETAFGKIGGLSLGLPALGGLAGIGGAAGVQGIVEIADATRQLSGALGLLPATVGGVGVVMGTLKVAFHGVGDALKDMMADDPKKFLQDIANMGPAAAHSMLQIAQFRDQFKLAGGAIQDSFFTKIAADIAPLIQTWLPALASAGSKIAGILGSTADMLAKGLMTPQAMQVFQSFIDNIAKGLQALQPAIAPLANAFSILAQVGSSFFGQIGDRITQMATFFEGVIQKAAGSGQLQAWIQTGIDAFGHLITTVYQFGAAFNNIMSVADKFGGGGLLGFLDKISAELNNWTQSTAGQKALTDFFSTLRTATDAFTPMLKPLLDGIASIGTAFAQLGVETAPAWLDFFKTFAYEMAHDLGPAIVGMGPAVSQFLASLTDAFRQLMQTVGPQLPQMFQMLANAFTQLLPQIPQMAALFVNLVESVGPQLPKLFAAITDAIAGLVPLMPTIIGFMRDFVSVITLLVEGGDTIEQKLSGLANGIIKVGDTVVDALEGKIGKDLPIKAEQWGVNVVKAFIKGMADASPLGMLDQVAASIVDRVRQYWETHSPAEVGPLHDVSPNLMGEMLVKNMAAGMASAQSAVTAAATSTAAAAARALSSGSAGARAGGALAASGAAPAPGGAGTEGGALLPDNIAGADTSVLDAYLNHQFPENRGLKGLAKDLGSLLSVFQNGFNLAMQHVATPMISALGMIPGLNQQRWVKMSPQAYQAQQVAELQRKALEGAPQGPSWGQVLGTGPSSPGGAQQIPLGLTASSSKEDIQKAIIAAGRAHGLNDAAIQTALAVAAAESGFNPTISGGVQGSAGLVSGLFQQSPSAGWGSLAQVNDPNYAINAFYNAFMQQLAKNPTNPLLAAVLTQNPQLGSGAQGSSYWNAVSAQLGLGGQILSQLGPGVKGPTWQQLTGGGLTGPAAAIALPPGAKIGHDGSISVPPGTALPAVAPGGAPIEANPQSRAGTLGGASTTYTPQFLLSHGIAPLFTKQAPGSMAGAPPWVNQLAAAFGLTATDHPDTTLHGGEGQMGSWAFDFSGSVQNMQAFADYIKTYLAPQTLQAIWQNPQTGQQLGIAGGQILGPGQYYTTPGGSYADHTDHVHWATDVPPIMLTADGKAVPVQGMLPPGASPTLAGIGATPTTPATPYPDVNSALGLLNATKQPSVNDQLLQAYLQGNPALAGQINAARTPGASDQTVLSTLNSIDTTISGLKAQDAVGNASTIQALQQTQSQIAQGAGFTQGQSAISMVSQVASSTSNIASSIIQSIQSGLQSLTATQDIADRVVYGIRDTDDVNKIIDDVQSYVKLASDIAGTTGAVLQTIGGLVGAGGAADTSGSSQATSMALSSAGQIANLISGALAGVNAAIDYGQQIYQVAGTYVGRALSYMTAGVGGTPLMGNVRLELDKNTGQLITYSEDNPQNQNFLNVPSWMNQTYDYGGGQNPNPQVNNQWTIYGGPGQSAGELLNQTMWLANTQGTTGAMAAQNF